MAPSARNIACFALLVSIFALQVPSYMDQRGTAAGSSSASASAPPSLLDGAMKAMLPLAGMDALFVSAAIIYRHHTHRAAVGNWRISELVFFILCLQVGVLQPVLFVQQPAPAAGDAARAVGTSAAHALPWVIASVTFFLGIFLIYAHVGNGGGAVSGNGGLVPAPASVRLLANMTLGAALVCLMSTILTFFYINTPSGN